MFWCQLRIRMAKKLKKPTTQRKNFDMKILNRKTAQNNLFDPLKSSIDQKHLLNTIVQGSNGPMVQWSSQYLTQC